MKKKSDFLGKALVAALILIVIDLIGGLANLRFETWFRWLPAVVQVAIMIYLCIQFAKEQNNGVGFGKIFGFGFKISLIVAILVALYSLLSIYVIFPELTDIILAKTRTDMESKGTYTPEVIDNAVAMTKKFLSPPAIFIFGFLSSLLFGTIGSLLGAAFAKKSEPGIFENNP